MHRPSTIDRLPEEVREEISRLRRHGRTIDEILDKLRELLAEDQQPSRSAIGRHIKKVEVLAERAKRADAIADRLVGTIKEGGEDKLMRANAKLLSEGVFELLSAVEDGEAVTLDPKDAKALSETLRNISTAQKNHAEFVVRVRREAEAEAKKKLSEAVATGGFDQEMAVKALQILGFAT